MAALVVVASVAVLLTSLLGGADLESLLADPDEVLLLLATNLLLGAGIAVAVLAVRVGHGYRPRWVSSVVGGLRWGWMLRCALVALVVGACSTGLLWLLAGPPEGTGTRVVPLLLVVLLTTPLQAAGEEYVFRGWISQSLGALFARAAVGPAAAAAVSGLLFALAHGGQNVFLFVDRLAFGLLASWLCWRTGGLEAAIAAHAVNNVVVFVPVVLTGGLTAALGVTEVAAGVVALDVVSLVVLGFVLTWLARRDGVRRVADEPGPDAALLAGSAPWSSVHTR